MMNKIRIINSFLLFSLIMLAACKKDSEVFVPNEPTLGYPDTTWVDNIESSDPISILRTALKPALKTKSFNLDGGTNSITIYLENNISITVPQASLINPATNNNATGSLVIDYIITNSRGNMIRNLTTSQSGNNLFDVAGQFYISFRQGNQVLQLDSTKSITIHFYSLISHSEPLDLFFGSEYLNAGTISWALNNNLNNSINDLSNPCVINSNKTGWIQAAETENHNSTNLKTIALQLPNFYTNANTQAFFSFNNYSASVMSIDPNIADRKFKMQTNIESQGAQGMVIVIARMGSDYFLGLKSVTINGNSSPSQQIDSIFPAKRSFQDIVNVLDSLQ